MTDAVLGARTAAAGLNSTICPGNRPVKKHFDGGQVLLHRGVCQAYGKAFDVTRDVNGADVFQFDVAFVHPFEEPGNGPEVSHAGIFVADSGCKKFQKAQVPTEFAGDGSPAVTTPRFGQRTGAPAVD